MQNIQIVAPHNIDANDVLQKSGKAGLIQQVSEQLDLKQDINLILSDESHHIQTIKFLTQTLNNILIALSPINFEQILHIEYQDDLNRYMQKSGIINIPKSLIAVVVVDKTLQKAKELTVNICKKNYESYVYNSRFWEKIELDTLKRFLNQAAICLGYLKSESKTVAFQELLIKTFWLNTDFPQLEENQATLINLNNCTLAVTSDMVNIRPHNPNDFMLYQLQFSYNQSISAPIFHKYLNRVLPDTESQLVLQEWIGYIFTKNLKFEKCAILYGSGRNGKSVFFEILLALLGKTNVKTFSLKQLQEEHNRAALDGKLLNYGSEINSGIDPDLFKQLASGEPVQARHKYGNPFEIHNYARLMFNANELPKDVEHTEAFFRRFLLIHFDQVIMEQEVDHELANKIIAAELPGVLNWLIDGIKRLQVNKRFTNCKKSSHLLATYRKESDSVALYLEDRGYIPDNYQNKLLKEVYSDFKNFLLDGGYAKMSDRTFSKRARELGYKISRGTDNKNFIYLVSKYNLYFTKHIT